MKVIRRNYGVNMTAQDRAQARRDAQDTVIARGTDRKPDAPRDVVLTPAPRGLLANWRAPAFAAGDLAGFRIYKDDETKLFAEIRDPTATQHFVEATAGTTPPTTNIFVSSVSKLGRESAKVMAQGAAIAETGAPAMPTTPATYTTQYATATTSGSRSSCFSGNTRVYTLHKWKRIEEIESGDRVCSRLGWKRVAFVEVHELTDAEMIDMRKGELVTPEHRLYAGSGMGFKPAAEVLSSAHFPRVRFTGKVYNLELDTPSKLDDDHCFRLVNGRFAHNLKP